MRECVCGLVNASSPSAFEVDIHTQVVSAHTIDIFGVPRVYADIYKAVLILRLFRFVLISKPITVTTMSLLTSATYLLDPEQALPVQFDFKACLYHVCPNCARAHELRTCHGELIVTFDLCEKHVNA